MNRYFNTEDLTSLKKIMTLNKRLQQAANNDYKAEKAVEVKAEQIKKDFLKSFSEELFKERILARTTEEEQAEIDREIKDCKFFLKHPERVEEWAGFDPYDFNDCYGDAFIKGISQEEYYANMYVKNHINMISKPLIRIYDGVGEYFTKAYPLFDLLTEAEKAEYYTSIEVLRKECAQKEKEIAEKRAEAQEILRNFDLMEVVRRNTFIKNVEFLRFEGKNKKIYLLCDHEGHKKEIEFFPSTQERDRDNTERLLELLAVQKDPWSLKDC